MIQPDEAVRIPVRRRDEVGLGTPARQPANPLRAASSSEKPHPEMATSPEAKKISSPGVDWQEATMRLQAEMQNFRRRQQRRADDEVDRERARLLHGFLGVVDSLEQSLGYLDPHDPVHQGVQLAYDGMLALLIREGVERVFAQGRLFDPDIHEAVATVPARPGGVPDMHIVEVLSQGYRYGDQILRPAKVVVARKTAQ